MEGRNEGNQDLMLRRKGRGKGEGKGEGRSTREGKRNRRAGGREEHRRKELRMKITWVSVCVGVGVLGGAGGVCK